MDFPQFTCEAISLTDFPDWDSCNIWQSLWLDSLSPSFFRCSFSRHTCPNCGDKRSFTYYVDESGTPLHPSVGRCNHESSCGYLLHCPTVPFPPGWDSRTLGTADSSTFLLRWIIRLTESSCGYHYTPKEYFHDHPECRTANGFSFGRQKSEQKSVQKPRQAAIGCIPLKYVGRAQSVHSNFFRSPARHNRERGQSR